jgi:hypothetical protein
MSVPVPFPEPVTIPTGSSAKGETPASSFVPVEVAVVVPDAIGPIPPSQWLFRAGPRSS